MAHPVWIVFTKDISGNKWTVCPAEGDGFLFSRSIHGIDQRHGGINGSGAIRFAKTVEAIFGLKCEVMSFMPKREET